MSDRVTNLVPRAQSGDHTAAAELFSMYWRLARAAAFGVTGEWAAAEDAAAEGFRQAWAGIPSLQDADKFASWLRTIVIRQARCQAWEAGKVLELPPDAADPGESPEGQLQREQLAAVIRLALRHLPESLRETMALRYFEGYEPEEAARLLQIPHGTLRRRLHEGRTRLRAAVESILKGEKMPNKPDLDHLHRLLAEGDIYRAVRGALQLQPPAAELAASFRSKPKPPGAGVADAIHRMLRGHSSNSSADAMADSIRQALPSHFEDWVENEGEAARQFLTAGKRALPPGFAEGRPGAFVRRTRGLLHVDAEGRSQSMPEMVRAIADPQEFQAAAMAGMRLTEVLDLLWMVEGSLELREVQELAARLWGAVIPEIEPRFTSYSAAGLTRYRAALAIEFEGTAAVGGILAEWAGRPAGVDAAHLRIFLEAWTNAQARQGGRTPHAQA